MSAWKAIADSKAGQTLVLVVAGGVAVWFITRQLEKFVPDGDTFDPTSDQNLAYRGTNAIGAAVTGDKDFSLGSWIYDLTHAAYDPNADTPPFVPRTVQVREEANFFERLLGK